MDMSPAQASVPATPANLWLKHPAHALSFGFGSGLAPIAPGTVATLWAWVVFLMLDPIMSDVAWGLLLLVGLVVGVRATTFTGKALGQPDASSMVWDEIIAFWLVLWILPKASDPAGFYAMGSVPEWLIQFAGFLLFRFFDVVKPAPIRTIDRFSKDGWGVMLDDLVAAAYTLLACAVLLRAVHIGEAWF
jgi:phosphatidylglycerophosphatase A